MLCHHKLILRCSYFSVDVFNFHIPPFHNFCDKCFMFCHLCLILSSSLLSVAVFDFSLIFTIFRVHLTTSVAKQLRCLPRMQEAWGSNLGLVVSVSSDWQFSGSSVRCQAYALLGLAGLVSAN